MKLSRDPEVLKIPAFMRNRVRVKKSAQRILAPAQKKPTQQKVRRPVKKRTQKQETFSAPLLDFAEEIQPPKKSKSVGIITHYYDKIRVSVIKLSAQISVGDQITYETDNGEYSQIIDSMQIDRSPVFKAGKGKEIGIKLMKMPKIGGRVKLGG